MSAWTCRSSDGKAAHKIVPPVLESRDGRLGKQTFVNPRGMSVKCHVRESKSPHSALMPAALMIGHHFSISALWCAASASEVCLPRGQIP
jgi:hypothetical protein